jgi:hypothetical protein
MNVRSVAGWGSGRPRWSHKPESAGSNPAPAPTLGVLLLVLVAALAGSPAMAQAPVVETNLYAGRLLILDWQHGPTDGGSKLWTARMTSTVRLKGGLQLGARGDVTALEQIDPTTLDLSAARSLEGYAGLSRPWAVGGGLTIGPALVAGTLVPTGQRGQPTYGAGARFAFGRSWLYALVGTNRAADSSGLDEWAHTRNGDPPDGEIRLIVAGSIELHRVALVGDLVGGPGGYVRLGLLVRVPTPGGGQ